MGSQCCGCAACKQRKEVPNRQENINALPGFTGFGMSGASQMMILGEAGVGKTTLMYKTIFPRWDTTTQQLQPTVGFHFEEVQRHGLTFGMWEASGAPAMQSISQMIYETVHVTAIVYVVSLLDRTDLVRLDKARRTLRRLLCDDYLKESAIAVVINTFGEQEDSDSVMRELVSQIGVVENEDVEIIPGRITYFVVDAKNGEGDAQWNRAIAWLVEWMKRMR